MKTEKIKSADQINIGDTFVYTGNPRGTGMFVPEIGQKFKMQTQNDVIGLSIEMIERGRGYEKVIEE